MDVKLEVEAIVAQRPMPQKYGGTGGRYKIHHDKKVVEIDSNFPREARHPDEYGARGRAAEKKMDDFGSAFYRIVELPLKKLGYTADEHAW